MSASPTNADRANMAAAALRFYKRTANRDADDRETNLADLLADLRHYCDRERIDFDACNARAADFHCEETSQGGA